MTSMASLFSKQSSILSEDERPEEMTDEELVRAVEELTQETRYMFLENTVVQRYLTRMEPSLVSGIEQILEQAATHARLHYVASSVLSATSISSYQSGASYGAASPRSTTMAKRIASSIRESAVVIPRVNMSYKMDMVARETDELRSSLEKLQATSTRTRATLQAELEAAEVTLRETQMASEELEIKVLKEGIEEVTGRVPAEKFTWHMKEWLKRADQVTQKLRLRTSTLRHQDARLRVQLAQKEELGESLHPVDFEQLKIENQDFADKIEQKNHDLLDLKRMTGRCSLQLNNYKKQLLAQLQELAEVRDVLVAKQLQLDAMETEIDSVMEHVREAQTEYDDLKVLTENYRVPEVIDYVRKIAELDDLRRNVRVWNRRYKVQQTALHTCTEVLRRMTTSSSYVTQRDLIQARYRDFQSHQYKQAPEPFNVADETVTEITEPNY